MKPQKQYLAIGAHRFEQPWLPLLSHRGRYPHARRAGSFLFFPLRHPIRQPKRVLSAIAECLDLSMMFFLNQDRRGFLQLLTARLTPTLIRGGCEQFFRTPLCKPSVRLEGIAFANLVSITSATSSGTLGESPSVGSLCGGHLSGHPAIQQLPQPPL